MFSCDKTVNFFRTSPLGLPAKGLTQDSSGRLIWELNIGVLNDRDFPLHASADIRALLKRAGAELSRTAPGLNFRFIVDQPMNANFIMNRALGKKKRMPGGSRISPGSPLLLLSPGETSARLNRKKLERAGYSGPERDRVLRNLKELARQKALRGVPLLYNKTPAGSWNWRKYVSVQVRYDLIFTNGYIYEDDTRRGRGTDRGVRWFIGEAPGRRGMEGWGGLLVLAVRGKGTPSRAEYQKTLALLAGLVLPLGREKIQRLFRGETTLKEIWTACSSCAPAWKHRLSYLRGAAQLGAGKLKEGCRLIRSSSGAALDLGPGHPLHPGENRLRGMRSGAQKLLHFCKNRA